MANSVRRQNRLKLEAHVLAEPLPKGFTAPRGEKAKPKNRRAPVVARSPQGEFTLAGLVRTGFGGLLR